MDNQNNDAIAARRAALAEVEFKAEADQQGLSGIQVPNGKLAEGV